MLEDRRTSLRVGLVVTLLVSAPLAGCLDEVGDATKETLGAEDAHHPEADQGEEFDRGELEDTYESAFQALDADEGEIRRFSASMDLKSLEGAPEERIAFGMYIDEPEEVMIVSIEAFEDGVSSEDSTSAHALGLGEGFLMGVVHKTTFMGEPPELLAIYDANSSWAEQTDNMTEPDEQLGPAQDSGGEMVDPQSIVEELEEIPDEAELAIQTVTYEGEKAKEIRVHHDNETHTFDFRLVIDPDLGAPLLLDGTFRESANVSSLEDGAHVRAEFSYGEGADHEYKDALLRLETMTIHGQDDDAGSWAEVNETQSWTVKPSQNPGSVPLEEVEIQMRGTSGGGFSGESEAKLTLAAEEGQTSTTDATLVYEDRDDDGHVSPGDEIRFVHHTTEAQGWSVSVHDEQTGLRTVPGPGLGLVLAMLGLVVAGARTRR